MPDDVSVSAYPRIYAFSSFSALSVSTVLTDLRLQSIVGGVERYETHQKLLFVRVRFDKERIRHRSVTNGDNTCKFER